MMIKLDMIKNNDNYHKSFTVMSNYICLRFGYCNSKSQGDFIDNINADLNIYLATGTDDNQKEFLLCYINDDFFVLPNESINGNLDKLSEVKYVSDYTVEKGVINYANVSGADAIAVATHGRTGFAHFLAGSISEDIANHASLPVVTFRIK